MLKKIPSKVSGSLSLVLSLALALVVVIIAACSGSSGGKSEEEISSSSAGQQENVINTDIGSLTVEINVAGNRNNTLRLTTSLAGNTANEDFLESGLDTAYIIFVGEKMAFPQATKGRTAFNLTSEVIKTFDEGDYDFCDSQNYQVCVEVHALDEYIRECGDFNRGDRVACGDIALALPSSSSAAVAVKSFSGPTSATITSSTPSCINLSSPATLENTGNICLTRDGLIASESTLLSYSFGADATKRYSDEIPNPTTTENFSLSSNQYMWFESSGSLDQVYHVACTDGGKKSEWDSNCYLVLVENYTSSPLSGTIKIWKVN